jgi:thymidylate kinase
MTHTGESVVVEFVGMPGSGKSTLAHATAELLRARGLTVWEPTFAMDHLVPHGPRQIRKLTHAANGLLNSRRSAVTFAGAALRSAQRHRSDLPPVVVNWWYLLDAFRRAVATPGVHLFDQGLLQALWSLGYGARRPHTAIDQARPAVPRCERHVVVSVRVRMEVALARIRARPNGESRVDREVAAGRGELALARAKMIADAVDGLAHRLAAAGQLTLVQFDNDRTGAQASSASALADQLAPAWAYSDRPKIDPVHNQTEAGRVPPIRVR